MASSDLREVLLPIIAVVIHPLITIGLFVFFWRCVRPHFQKHSSSTPACPTLASQSNNGCPYCSSGVTRDEERPLSISIILSPLLLVFDERLPSYWTNRGNCVEKVDITDTSTTEFIRIIVNKLWSPSDVGKGKDATSRGPALIEITRVYRFENAELFIKYNEKRRKMVTKRKRIKKCHFPSLQELSSSEISSTEIIRNNHNIRNSHLNEIIDGINEHFLFHGTQPGNVDSIWMTGLGTEYSTREAFGKGIYMAEKPTKSDQYTGPQNVKHMFLCRACLGEMYVLKTMPSEVYDTPPCREPTCLQWNCKAHKYRFDSVVADIPNARFREFVVQRDYWTYPEYLIIYKHIYF